MRQSSAAEVRQGGSGSAAHSEWAKGQLSNGGGRTSRPCCVSTTLSSHAPATQSILSLAPSLMGEGSGGEGARVSA
eukprot:1801203-Pyramimonas_sp.AAC.1